MSETSGGHGLSGGQESARNPKKALEAFPTHNVYSACAACECAFPIVLTYDDEEQTPVPNAEFTVKWGEWVQDDSQPGGGKVVRGSNVPASAQDINGVTDANGLALINPSPCGSAVLLTDEGSDDLEPTEGDEASGLFAMLKTVEVTMLNGVPLSEAERGELLAWITAKLKHFRSQQLMQNLASNPTAEDLADARAFVEQHGSAVWGDDRGKQDKLLAEINSASAAELVADNTLRRDGVLFDLSEALGEQSAHYGELPSLPNARIAAQAMMKQMFDDTVHHKAGLLNWWEDYSFGKPNDNFYKVLAGIKQAEEAAGKLGALSHNDSTWGDVVLTIAECILGCIPVVGDVMDVVDIIRWIWDKTVEQSSIETIDWIELGTLFLGFIPALGAPLKKTFGAVVDFMRRIASGPVDQALRIVMPVIRGAGNGKGSIIKWLRKQSGKVDEYAGLIRDFAKTIVTAVTSGLRYLGEKAGFVAGYAFRKFSEGFEWLGTKIDEMLCPLFRTVRKGIDDLLDKLLSRFTANVDGEEKVFTFFRRNSGSAGQRGAARSLDDYPCPKGLGNALLTGAAIQGTQTAAASAAQGSNPINMVLGWPMQMAADAPMGLFEADRVYAPGQGNELFGPNWASRLSSWVSMADQTVVYNTAASRRIAYDAPARGEVAVHPEASDYTLTSTPRGYEVLDADGITWRYETYDGIKRMLTAAHDPNGQGFEIDYAPDPDAALGLMPVAVRLTNGDRLTLEVAGRRLRKIAAEDGTVLARYDYNDRGWLTGATDAAGYRIGYGYDDKARLNRLDYNGEHGTHYDYDDEGRVVAVHTDTRYFHDHFEYHAPDADGIRETVFIDTLGHRHRRWFDEANNLIRGEEPGGATAAITWTDAGDPAILTDALGRVTAMDWDRFGNLAKRTMPDGTVEVFDRDDRGRLLAYTDAAGTTWSYERDDRGNVTAEHWPDGRVWRYALNGRGQPERIANPDGSTLTLAYDERHRLARWTDALGAVTEFEYDRRGRLTQRTEPDGTASRFTYDAAGRLTAATLADGRVLSWQWSARGDLLRATDGEGKAVTRDYGPYGLLERITDPKGGTIRFERDPLMRLTGVFNELGERYTYAYDAAGQVTAETDFSGRVLRYAYDIIGRLTEKIAGDGVRSAYTHDRADRLETVEVFDRGAGMPPSVTRYAYDPRGLMTEAQNRDATVALERDVLGRVTRETVNGRSVESTYNANGELAARDFDGRMARYAYDANGLMSAMAIGGHAPLDFERDIMGRERMRRSAAGFAEARLWDRLGQLRAQAAGRADGQFFGPQLAARDYWEAPEAAKGGAGVARHYSYDRAFNPTEIVDARWGAARYDYDANDQVTRAAYEHTPGAGLIEERFAYDAARNISAEAETTRGASLSLGEAEPQRTLRAEYARTPGGRIERRGNTTYAYDDQGRMISKRVEKNGFRPQKWRYEWDGEDQLRRVETPDGALWEYTYDPFGRRIGKRCVRGAASKQARQVDYLWAGNLLSEERRVYADGSEQTVAYHYEQGSFRPIAQEVDGALTYIVTDHLGTPKELLSEEGDVVWSVKHELWGGIRAMQHISAANDNAGAQDCLLRFQGQIEDEETGLYYNRFRYYDPASGNYVSSDPIGLAGGVRPANYVSNSNYFVDPLGLNGMGPFQSGVNFDITQDMVDDVKLHLSNPDNFGGEAATDWKPNQDMINRLQNAVNTTGKVSGADASFLHHELYEKSLMDKGVNYDDAHKAALEKYQVDNRSVYHPDVIKNNPDDFNNSWRKFHGINC